MWNLLSSERPQCASLVAVLVNLMWSGGDPDAELVRHFLIETTSKGVRLKGCNNEPTFGELAVFITSSQQ